MTEIVKLSQEEQNKLQDMLKSEKLCYNDISQDGVQLFGVKIKQVLIGYFGFEVFGQDALFRSMLVKPDARKRGYGTLIWNEAKEKLKARGVTRAYLLTTTAANFFNRQGFKVIPRNSVPDSIANTNEFRDFCPDSSTCMMKYLAK